MSCAREQQRITQMSLSCSTIHVMDTTHKVSVHDRFQRCYNSVSDLKVKLVKQDVFTLKINDEYRLMNRIYLRRVLQAALRSCVIFTRLCESK